MDKFSDRYVHPTMNNGLGSPLANSLPEKLDDMGRDKPQAEDKKKEEEKKKKEEEEKKKKGEEKETEIKVETEVKLKKVEINVGGFFIALANFALHRGAKDDDAVDRFNHMFMYGLFVLLAAAAGMKQYVGEPIHCWLPAEYKEDRYKDYVKSFCWVHPMYNVGFEDMIPKEESERFFNPIGYYRWITVFFIAMAVLFRIPQLLWKELKKLTGANLEKMNAMVLETAMMDGKKRDQRLGHVAEFLHRWLTTRYYYHGDGLMAKLGRIMDNCWGRRSGHYLVGLYLFIKVLFLVNAVGQFYLVSWFIRTNFWSFGSDAMSDYAEDGKWENLYIFPRIALCDFHIRQLQNIQTFTVQCVLSVNLFLEKMFLLAWICLIITLIANGLSLLKWTYHLVFDSNTKRFLMTYPESLVFGSPATREEKKEFREMVRSYLKPDGVFLLRMLALNTTDIVIIDLLRKIWARYQEQKGKSQ